jgi:hypothetical protein
LTQKKETCRETHTGGVGQKHEDTRKRDRDGEESRR